MTVQGAAEDAVVRQGVAMMMTMMTDAIHMVTGFPFGTCGISGLSYCF